MGIWDRFTKGDPKPEDEKEIKKPAPKIKNKETEAKPKRYKIPLCKTSTSVNVVRGALLFECPICESLNSLPLNEIDPIVGTEVMCLSCQEMLHVPGGYRTGSEVKSLKIFAAIPVAISKFPILYQNHPIIQELSGQGIMQIIIQYGMWGFCQKCHHEFSPAVLINLPQTTSDIVDVRSLTSEEMTEMLSLRKGACPYCGHRILLVIISEIPHYVISASENLSHRWDND